MAEPSTPGEVRRHGLRRARWVAAGASVGAAVLLTGTIAAVNAAPSATGRSGRNGEHDSRSDDDLRDEIDDDEFGRAEPFSPEALQQQVPRQSSPQLAPRPQTRSRGS
ncbi:MAG: hypothetical protein AMXMBFR46_08160 [Acidimicrobiia bacterium]